MTDAIIYCRYSDAKQEKGVSLERQLEDCRAMIVRHGWVESRVIQDLGKSAWKGHHLSIGNLGKLTKEIKDGLIEQGTVLVVERLDRLSRQDPHEALQWIRDANAAGVKVATASGDVVYDRETSQSSILPTFEILLKGKLANDESQIKSERVTDAKRRAFKKAQDRKGAWVITTRVPGWLTVKPGRDGFIVREDRAQIVRDIYKMSAAGMGAPGIASSLNRSGVPAWGTWRKDHSTPTWDTGYVKNILAHPAVEGDYVPGATNQRAVKPKLEGRINGYFPRIVDADLVDRAREAVSVRRVNRGRQGDGVANLFAGLVECDECGGNCYVGWSTRGKRYLRCDAAARKRGCENRGSYNYQDFEKAVVDDILHLAVDDAFFAVIKPSDGLSVRLSEAKKILAEREQERANLVKVLSRLPDDEEVLRQVDALGETIRAVKLLREALEEEWAIAKGAVSPAEQASRIREIRTAMESDDPAIRGEARYKVQQALRGIVDRVLLSSSGGDRRITVMMVGGWHVVSYDMRGMKVWEYKHGPDEDWGIALASNPKLKAYVQRLQQGASAPSGTRKSAWSSGGFIVHDRAYKDLGVAQLPKGTVDGLTSHSEIKLPVES